MRARHSPLLTISADDSALKFDTTTSLMNEVSPRGLRNCMRSPSLARCAKAARKHWTRAVPHLFLSLSLSLPWCDKNLRLEDSGTADLSLWNTRTANFTSAALSPRSGMPITLASRYNEISRDFNSAYISYSHDSGTSFYTALIWASNYTWALVYVNFYPDCNFF